MERNSVNFLYDPEELESRIRKKKRVSIDGNSPICLNLNIRCAQDIDKLCHYPLVFKRQYCVLYWVDPTEQFYTRLVSGLLDPHWNEKDQIVLEDSCDDYGFLYVEVVRMGFPNDPGTSTGTKVMGRAKIPMPRELNRENRGSFGLMRMEDGELKCQGSIVLSMELKKMENSNYLFPRF